MRRELAPSDFPTGLSQRQQRVKRAFDLALAVPGLVIVSPIIVAGVAVATISTGRFGVFTQTRIGQYGEHFKVWKARCFVDRSA